MIDEFFVLILNCTQDKIGRFLLLNTQLHRKSLFAKKPMNFRTDRFLVYHQDLFEPNEEGKNKKKLAVGSEHVSSQVKQFHKTVCRNSCSETVAVLRCRHHFRIERNGD